MRIPKEVRVGSVDYTINLCDERQILNSRQCYGIIDYDYHTIELDGGIQDSQGIEQTLLHELIHAIVRENKINLDGDFEEVTDKLAYGLHQVIRDNPVLFENREPPKVL